MFKAGEGTRTPDQLITNQDIGVFDIVVGLQGLTKIVRNLS